METHKLFGVTKEVANAMMDTMTHREYLRVGVALMNRIQKLTVQSVQDKDFKYRTKAINNYEKWSKNAK